MNIIAMCINFIKLMTIIDILSISVINIITTMAQFISDTLRNIFRRSISVQEVQHQIDLFEPYCVAFLRLNANRYTIHQLTDKYTMRLSFEPWNNDYASIVYENSQGNVFQGIFHLVNVNCRHNPIISAHLLTILFTSDIVLSKSQISAMERSIHPFVAVNVIVMAMMGQRRIQHYLFDMLMRKLNITMVSVVHCLPLDYLLLVYGENYHIEYLINCYPQELPRILSDYNHCLPERIINRLETAIN
jgi:hypothetical protein